MPKTKKICRNYAETENPLPKLCRNIPSQPCAISEKAVLLPPKTNINEQISENWTHLVSPVLLRRVLIHLRLA